MKKLKVLLAVVLALVLVLGCVVLVFGAEGDPGTAGDPIVTKGYVDRAIENLKAAILAGSLDNPEGTAPAATAEWEIVKVDAGKSVLGGQGTQIILRSGTAFAIGNASNGVSDLTGGTDLATDVQISANHLLLVPRADGRGIRCESECWIMVLGAYELK